MSRILNHNKKELAIYNSRSRTDPLKETIRNCVTEEEINPSTKQRKILVCDSTTLYTFEHMTSNVKLALNFFLTKKEHLPI
jgi:hypothetical protein